MPRKARPRNIAEPTPENMVAVKIALDRSRVDARINLAELPEDAADMVRSLLETYAEGRRPRVIPENAELSTFEAAALLNVSRPHVIKLLDDGAMHFRMVGAHRRIRLPDVLAYKEKAVAPSVPVRLPLDEKTERVARAFMRRLEGKYPGLNGMVFGSRARGDHAADSDADIAVILKGEPGDRWALTREFSGVAFDIMLETGVLVQAIPVWEGELRHPELFSNPALIDNIKREGVRL